MAHRAGLFAFLLPLPVKLNPNTPMGDLYQPVQTIPLVGEIWPLSSSSQG
ncbi:hypothetical protein L581_0798 [Serratia fonticola AU-AP2C]|nr:hypothetical protein L581_0798 [Serratia fonticola AU-AP2C]